MEFKDKTKFESVKNHLIKHKTKYIAGGTLLLGFGLGLYLSKKKYGSDEGPVSDHIDSQFLKNDSSKIIGKFQEIDGEEYATLGNLMKAKKLIGSTSADVGNVVLYYDNDGNTYAVAHGFEEYYGKKSV